MPPPVPKRSPSPAEMPDSDLIDRTMEVDMRWLQYDTDDDSKPAISAPTRDEPTVVLDLTATQVHDLLEKKK